VPEARTSGERQVAFVVPRTGEMVDSAEIAQYCALRLVNYKRPSEVRVVEQLPITAAHKLDHAALRRAARGEQIVAVDGGLVIT
jgi:long-chain acyl-CoA synthetase